MFEQAMADVLARSAHGQAAKRPPRPSEEAEGQARSRSKPEPEAAHEPAARTSPSSRRSSPPSSRSSRSCPTTASSRACKPRYLPRCWRQRCRLSDRAPIDRSRRATRMPIVKPATTSISDADQNEEERRRGRRVHDQKLDEAGDEHQHRQAVIDQRDRGRVGGLHELGEQAQHRHEDDQDRPSVNAHCAPLIIVQGEQRRAEELRRRPAAGEQTSNDIVENERDRHQRQRPERHVNPPVRRPRDRGAAHLC